MKNLIPIERPFSFSDDEETPFPQTYGIPSMKSTKMASIIPDLYRVAGVSVNPGPVTITHTLRAVSTLYI